MTFVYNTVPTMEQPQPAEANPAEEARPRKILVVDDVADNRVILVRRLQRRGFDVVEADGGIRALELIAQEPFDLVLLDIMMPDLSGLEVLRRVREQHGSLALPVIMVTAKTQSEDVVKALAIGANDYVTKPVDIPVVFARVDTQLALKDAEDLVRRANEQLQGANDTLEQRVAERTTELMDAVWQLQQQITERERSDAHIRYLAHHDALTGLGNRTLFRERLEQVHADPQGKGSLAVLFLDLDGFKNINDTLGHSVGDAVLKCVADRLRDNLRDSDRIVRLGGDEFAVIQIAEEQPESAAALANQLVELICKPMRVQDHELAVGVSIGIATSSGPDQELEQLLRAADLAMYQAKADGKCTYRFFEPEMDMRAQARRVLERDLRSAWAAGQFELHYQPQVSLETNRIVGFEALLRWRHPERGLVPPLDFIPMAEEIGLIVPIGEWVLKQACRDAAAWPGNLRVAVNLSPAQFKSGDVVSSVVNALAASGLPPHRLELEITETVLLARNDVTGPVLKRLHDLGVHIAMDDFGTGYSSLSYLLDFPFDKIKIDKSFVHGMSQRAENLAIVRAVAKLGSSFNADTTAEGVETAEQLERIKAEGCTEAQGFLFSRPIPVAEVVPFLQSAKLPHA